MEFKDLYSFAEDAITEREKSGKKTAVPVRNLADEIIQKTIWLESVNIYPVDHHKNDPFGHYECHGNQESHWEEADAWTALITYNNTLNICEKRFVVCKELMHVFDKEQSQVRNGDQYKILVTEIELRPINQSEQYISENTAQWMALLVLCPKIHRDKMVALAENDTISFFEVALKFRIPESVVQSLISEYYDSAYDLLIQNG